jgi:uncharacterized RDD family membrane protein YckC
MGKHVMSMQRRTFTAHEADRINALDGTPLASFRRRAVAFAVDFVLVLVIYLAASVPFALRARGASGGDLILEFNPFDGLWGLVAMIVYFGLLTYIGKGRTPGKRLMRIRVVSTSHERLSLWHSIERALGYAASALEGGFGFAQYFVHPNHRTVHDRIAETIVVDEGRQQRASGG